ncbi:hypothetical protein [Streptomyces sp. NPDC001568]|uniref:hypothetical protein n=1 Tax=Streptomyces sp. NPDC001568 TaxID=3364588 RepID=UPI0036A97EF3
MLAVTLPTAATAAVGDVQVSLSSPGDDGQLITAPRKLIKSPEDGRCYTVKELFPDAPAGSTFGSVGNHSSAAVFVYQGENCSGAPWDPTPLSAGMVTIGAPIQSLKIKPGPSLETPPVSPPPARP